MWLCRGLRTVNNSDPCLRTQPSVFSCRPGPVPGPHTRGCPATPHPAPRGLAAPALFPRPQRKLSQQFQPSGCTVFSLNGRIHMGRFLETSISAQALERGRGHSASRAEFSVKTQSHSPEPRVKSRKEGKYKKWRQIFMSLPLTKVGRT